MVWYDVIMKSVKLNIVDYKGKHYIYQDADMKMDHIYERVIGTITKKELLKDVAEIKSHIKNCNHYGITPYHGEDNDLNNVFKDE